MNPYQTPSADELARLKQIAEAMHASGDYLGKKDKQGNWSGVTSAEQALNRILIGRDLGLSPAQAMMGIDLVRGNLMIRGVLLAAFVRQSKDYTYHVLQHDHNGCQLWFLSRDPNHSTTIPATGRTPEREVMGAFIGESIFTIQDAEHAKLIREGSPWQTVPKSMVFWRAMSNGVKWYCPDLLGGMPVYTEADEIRVEAQPGDGAGDGTAPGWDIPDDLMGAVQAALTQAEISGHAGLADVGSVQMTLNGQPREFVEGWLETARKQLDALAEAEKVEAP